MRVTTLAQQTFTLAQIQSLQSRIADQNIAITSGKTAQRYSGIAEEAKRLVSLEATHVQLTGFVTNNNLVDQSLQSMESSMSQLVDIANDFRTALIESLNSNNAASSGIDIEAQNLLQQVASMLNTEFDGRYLFAGSKTDTAPVDLNDPGFLPPPAVYPGTADTSYYQGDQETLSARASADLTISYGVRADEAAVEKLVRAIHLTATATVSPVPDTARLNESLRLMAEVIDELPLVVSRIGVARASLEIANAGHDETLLYAEQTIGELANTNLTEAITFLSADRSTLEASFATLAQMSSISLLRFL